jgi:hypothetical protein
MHTSWRRLPIGAKSMLDDHLWLLVALACSACSSNNGSLPGDAAIEPPPRAQDASADVPVGGADAPATATCGDQGAQPLPMDSTGWVPASSNAYGIQGQWACWTDRISGGLSTFPGLVDGTAPFAPGRGMCVTGTTPGGQADNYITWGANINLTLNQASPTSAPSLLTRPPRCFTVTVTGSAPGGLVGQLCPTTGGGWGTVCPQIDLSVGANEVCIDNVVRPSYCDTSPGLTCYTPEQLKLGVQQIAVQGSAGAQGGTIDFCVTSIVPHDRSCVDAGVDSRPDGTNYTVPDATSDYGSGALPPITPGKIDPQAMGKADVSDIVFPAFSVVANNKQDPQVLDLVPDLLPRAWCRWDIWGLKSSDFDFTYPTACHAKNIRFMGGTTASAFFKDEVSEADFWDQVTRDAWGQAVPHPEFATNGYRASLANPSYRQRLVDIAKIQLDGGADGIHFDEVYGGYTGANWVGGNEGFDNYHVADFGAYLCAKYASTPSLLTTNFGLLADDKLDCGGPAGGRGFDYRAYIARHGDSDSPLSATNPLAADWGTNVNNRSDPTRGTFLEIYPGLVYWQQIVVALRSYARQRYGREILISANGIYPFVDFQSIGLYTPNSDAPNGASFDWMPVLGSDLNGTVSFKSQLELFKSRSKATMEAGGGGEVPILLFLDYATPSLNRYYALPLQGRKDYFRLFGAEAYALGMMFAVPIAVTTDANTATVLGMMDFFKQMKAFYKAHAGLYLGSNQLADVPVVSAPNVTTVLSRTSDGGTVLHLVNHNYAGAPVVQRNVSVSFPLAYPPGSVTLVSPDLPADQPTSFSYADGVVTISGADLDAYLGVVARP